MAWANLYPGVYCGLREYELAWAKIFPRGINWPRPHYTRVYSGRGYILACYTGNPYLFLCCFRLRRFPGSADFRVHSTFLLLKNIYLKPSPLFMTQFY